jgi:hypothetical protein
VSPHLGEMVTAHDIWIRGNIRGENLH